MVGAHDLDKPGIYTQTTVVYQGSYRIPSEYNRGVAYDVAVLSTRISISPDVEPIALPPAEL